MGTDMSRPHGPGGFTQSAEVVELAANVCGVPRYTGGVGRRWLRARANPPVTNAATNTTAIANLLDMRTSNHSAVSDSSIIPHRRTQINAAAKVIGGTGCASVSPTHSATAPVAFWRLSGGAGHRCRANSKVRARPTPTWMGRSQGRDAAIARVQGARRRAGRSDCSRAYLLPSALTAAAFVRHRSRSAGVGASTAWLLRCARGSSGLPDRRARAAVSTRETSVLPFVPNALIGAAGGADAPPAIVGASLRQGEDRR
jgi:hypothetical protein